MNTKKHSLHRLPLLAAFFFIVMMVSAPLYGQQTESTAPTGVPDDWTHHQVIFSDPGSVSQAAVRGKLDEWKQITQDPRFKMQQIKRAMMQRGAPPPAFDFATLAARISQQQALAVRIGEPGRGPEPRRPVRNEGAWSMVMGGAASQQATVNTNNASSTSSLVVDGVTLNASAPTTETATITFGATRPAGTSSVTIGNITYTFVNASSVSAGGTNACNIRSHSTTPTDSAAQVASNLYNAIHSGRTGEGTSTWECNSALTTGNSAVTSSFTSPTISLTAATTGSTGFTFMEGGTTNFSTFSSTLGTDGTQNGTTWTYWSGNAIISTTDLATNIADTINANTTLQTVSTGVTASTNADVITVTARSAGANTGATTATNFSGITWSGSTLAGGESPAFTPNIYPAKYSFNTSGTAGNCDSATTPDYVVYPTGLTGTGTQPNIIAYDNIYTSCSTSSVPFPNVYWQFNTGGQVTTSPVLSSDGKQVAFIQLSGGAAQLVLLKWNEDSALQSTTVESSAANYNTCSTKPCWYAITFAQTIKFKGGTGGATTPSTPTDTYSSPYYDYTSDTLYVGEDNGYLHKFTPVFNGAPTEVTSNWPVQVAVAPLISPVYDSNTSLAFTGPAVYASNSAAKFHSIPAAGGTASATSASYASTGTDGYPIFFDGALLDPSVPALFLSVNDNGSGSAEVYKISEALATLGSATIGTGAYAAGDPIYAGTFDNIYLTSSPSAGNLYVCGRSSTSGSQASELWKVNINGNTLTATAIDLLTTGTGLTQCSPVSEFDNGSVDHIFLSVPGNSQTASPVSCPSNTTGCLMSFTVTTALSTGASTTSKVSIAGGTSGIVIDNGSATMGNSQIYFFPLANNACGGNSDASAGVGTGLCAYQLSQSGLN